MANMSTRYVAVAVIIVVILAAVLIFSTTLKGKAGSYENQTSSSSCSQLGGFTCSDPSYSYSTGDLSLYVGQNTGSNWTNVQVIFVPAGTNYTNGVPNVDWTTAGNVTGGLQTGSRAYVTLPATNPVGVGTKLTGEIWAKYQLNIGGTYYYAELGNVTAWAT